MVFPQVEEFRIFSPLVKEDRDTGEFDTGELGLESSGDKNQTSALGGLEKNLEQRIDCKHS